VKHQYYGDVNDYRKYGLLRCLATGGSLSIGVCWMLTLDDGRTDGGLTSYLNAPQEWRAHDPGLYDHLKHDVVESMQRNVHRAEIPGLIPGAVFCSGLVPAAKPGRVGYFTDVLQTLDACQLLFFDPDNGIEVRSVPFGSRESPKYVYWRELIAAYSEGHSLLVYQHYPHQNRLAFHQRMAGEIARRMPLSTAFALKTPSVVYFLIVRPEHLDLVHEGLGVLNRTWRGQIAAEQLSARLESSGS